ncbi:Prephenate dehydratase [Gloeothece citriformis PCC 7424]|uniref:Prephenate dehydratase n=1 Tax=Gloeothece citriformis (strain PCC 7424) TaxID=65393 RepID=B7K831_GLOC7|nr:prephenate dehydratase [Gloeothece citriformis]ACK68519.1 Prephenate dehydratase [Gloeothece citriformis PCC 7424]
MVISIAHLGPKGTNAETAALAYSQWLEKQTGQQTQLHPYPTIASSLYAVAKGEVNLGVVPVENSTEGSVTITLDTLWELEQLQIQQEVVLPIAHCLYSKSELLKEIKKIYSHPQALAQCQKWLNQFLSGVELVATSSTAEALKYVNSDATVGAIASPRASKLYDIPILVQPINDYPDNCTRFWVVGMSPTTDGSHSALGFSVAKNQPGALVKPLQVFANRQINLSRIESRPTKRSLGEYLFFVDIERSVSDLTTQEALSELSTYTEILKIFGSYRIFTIESSMLATL